MKKKIFSICFVSITIIVSLYVLCTNAIERNQPKFTEEEYEVESYRVRKGDTLWALAEENIVEGDSVRAWINETEELNNGKADYLLEGQLIEIYIRKDNK